MPQISVSSKIIYCTTLIPVININNYMSISCWCLYKLFNGVIILLLHNFTSYHFYIISGLLSLFLQGTVFALSDLKPCGLFISLYMSVADSHVDS